MTTELTKPLPSPMSDGSPPPPRIVRALKAFEKAVGGRDTLVAELAPAALSDEESLVLRLLADPENDKWPLHEILGHAHVSLARFLKLFRDARGARAYLDALDRVWDALPEVAADVMKRALPREVFCKPCAGTGFQRIEQKRGKKNPKVVCPRCTGVGKVPVEPTLDYQRLALTLGGLPKATPTVHIDQSTKQQTTFVGSDTMRDFVAAVTRIKRTPQAAIDTEAIDTEATFIEEEEEDTENGK